MYFSCQVHVTQAVLKSEHLVLMTRKIVSDQCAFFFGRGRGDIFACFSLFSNIRLKWTVCGCKILLFAWENLSTNSFDVANSLQRWHYEKIQVYEWFSHFKKGKMSKVKILIINLVLKFLQLPEQTKMLKKFIQLGFKTHDKSLK